jgi:nucleoside-diphosphate-sugar epimerase
MIPSVDRLIIGCGYLGERVARRWLSAGLRVAALTRSRAAHLAEQGIEPVVGDVLDPLPKLPQARTVLYAVGFDRSVGADMRDVYVQGLANVLQALPEPERFLYVSSTGVYGDAEGGEVDEEMSIDPGDESGRVVAEAEALLRDRLPEAIILRFAGIYGPGRLMRADTLRSGQPIPGDPEQWLNLIHVEDGADAVLAAEA